MDRDVFSRRAVQLDEAERDRLQAVVADLRDRVEDNLRFQLERDGLQEKPADPDALEAETRQLVEAIELEAADDLDWEEARAQYVTGVGYTIVNRLAALRCMEVRGFIDEAVTVIDDNGLTPAAERLVHEEFLLESEALLEAYHRACDDLAEEIEILFDRSTAYSLVDPDDDAFEDLCRILDEIPDDIWRADDVLGWVYEYYNRPVVEAIDAKELLDPDDVGPANQFYTPHWVVRTLTDNALGKLYLESTGKSSTVPDPDDLSVEERKERAATPEAAPDVPSLCTYLIPDDEERDAPAFDHPRELRVIDPACGSGHFLLYAFDVLERIWWAETDLDRGEIPARILEHNLYGVDIDLRSCQLAAFNLYLKARSRAEAEGNDEFEMPTVGIVVADNRVAELESAIEVLREITGEKTDLREALDDLIEEFQTIDALGSLLDVRGALSGAFLEEQTDLGEWDGDGPKTLHGFLQSLREAVARRTADSFGERNLRSFLHLLVVLTQEYDVALMNPPYGSGGRMPDGVQAYVEEQYDYASEYYINFFEACDRLTRKHGRVGMLVPRSFMFLRSFREFREEFVGDRGSFDFLAEYGIGVLDGATVRTAGTVVRSGVEGGGDGTFVRLNDVEKGRKERSFVHAAFVAATEDGIQRRYERELSDFGLIPGTPLSYWVPTDLRALYESETVLDADNANLEDRETFGVIKQGLATADDDRFVRAFWEVPGDPDWPPFAKGGEDAWLLPRVKKTVLWEDDGAEIKRYWGSRPQNTQYYFDESLTYTVAKESGRRFGYLHGESIFGHKGSVLIPDRRIWHALSYTNSHLFTYLMLAQTTERMWEVGQVSKVPWRDTLGETPELGELSREAVGHVISKRQYDFVSPHYTGPVLLDVLGVDDRLDDRLPWRDHPHRNLREEVAVVEPAATLSRSDPLEELGVAAASHLERIEASLRSCADAIDEAVFDRFDVDESQRETILQEIALRTNDDPREREAHDPDAVSTPPEGFRGMVEDLLVHFALKIVREDDDGIVPLCAIEGQTDLLGRIEAEFDRVWGDHAESRLAEADRALGSRRADEEAYPNLRRWLQQELFEYHVSTFDGVPIVWRLTTERLVSDPEGEGFACLVDYHRLDPSLFDTLHQRYLDPRKQLLRERRRAADRRRGGDAVSAAERADAAEEYDRCESGLEQIAGFEARLADLARPDPREWPEAKQELAADAAALVAEFRSETERRLEAIDALAALEDDGVDDVDLGELFSETFYERVQEHREEWIDALDDLETAFEAYAKDGSVPVEAHLYDRFEYFEELVGSAHFASNGILFTTWYFERLDDPEQAQLGDGGASKRQELLSDLATNVEEYRDLAAEIGAACEAIADEIPSEWADRARSEITTAGYRPNHKHGVAINIAPLVEAAIVPD